MATAGERRSAADVFAKAKARTTNVALVLDGELLAEHEQLAQELDRLEATDARAKGIAARLVELEDEMRDAEVTFRFRGLGRGRWRKLLADYPPGPDDTGADFDSQEFPFAAMAACLVDPELTADDLKELHETVLSEMSFGELWSACLAVNIGAGSSRPESQAAHAIVANGRPRSLQPSA